MVLQNAMSSIVHTRAAMKAAKKHKVMGFPIYSYGYFSQARFDFRVFLETHDEI